MKGLLSAMKVIYPRKWFPTVFLLLCIPAPSQAQRLRPEKEAGRALAEKWRNVEHLPDGFPANFRPEIAAPATSEEERCSGVR